MLRFLFFSAIGSDMIGRRPRIIDASLHLLLQVPHYIPDQKKFELGVLVSKFYLLLLIFYLSIIA